jgi:trigger factor
MTMQVQVEQLTPVLMELSVDVDGERLKKELDKAFLDLQKRAKVKGFRPGKAPRDVLTHLYGGAVTNDVCSKLINQTLDEALQKQNVQPLSQPKIEVKSASNSILSYKARFEVRPEIKELKWEGLEAEKPKRKVDDAAVEQALEQLRKQHASLVVPEPARAAQDGDIVSIDFVADVDGKKIDSGTGLTVEIGSGKVLKELEAALVGTKTGELKDVAVTFAGGHANKDIAGKAATFHVTVGEIKERKLPNLDDEFAKDVGEYADLAALRTDTRAKLEKDAEDQAEQTLVTNLVAALCNANAVEAPSSLVGQQKDLTLQELRMSARRAGQNFQVTQELDRQLQVDSEVKVRAGLLMAEIAKLNNITVDDKDLENGLEELAKETGKNVARLRVEYRDQNRRQMLIGMILEDKVLDLLISKANVKEVEPAA